MTELDKNTATDTANLAGNTWSAGNVEEEKWGVYNIYFGLCKTRIESCEFNCAETCIRAIEA